MPTKRRCTIRDLMILIAWAGVIHATHRRPGHRPSLLLHYFSIAVTLAYLVFQIVRACPSRSEGEAE